MAISDKFIDKVNETYCEANSLLWRVKSSVDRIKQVRRLKRKTKNKNRLKQLEDYILDEKELVDINLRELEVQIGKFKNLFKNKKL